MTFFGNTMQKNSTEKRLIQWKFEGKWQWGKQNVERGRMPDSQSSWPGFESAFGFFATVSKIASMSND